VIGTNFLFNLREWTHYVYSQLNLFLLKFLLPL